MKEYYKIGEISKIYGIGRDSLMYYEELEILKRFRDKNGYRMYSISDIWKLNLIKELRGLNFSMKRIKEYLDDRSIKTTNSILNEEIVLIDEKIKEGIYNEFESVFCFLDNDEEIYNIVFDEGYYITLTYRGSYKNNKCYINNMIKFINLKGYEITSNPIEIYKIDIHETGCVEEFITEIQIPVKINK